MSDNDKTSDANDHLRELARKFALKNAIDYGKAIEGRVISRILFAIPSIKSNMKEVSSIAKEEVAKVNSLSKEELTAEYAKYASEFEEEEAKKAEKSSTHDYSIDGAEQGKFATRFPPEPGGYMHIGHTKPLFIEDLLREKYNGKFFLYFDDTNPDNEKQEYVDAFHDDLKWLGMKFDREYYASDHIPMLYEYAITAINAGKAYVCTCKKEEITEKRAAGNACVHKGQSIGENLEKWKMMLNGEFPDGEAILRLNSDMKSLNTTMRDPTLFRIKHKTHYRHGDEYFVWPTYDFCTPIVDSVEGVTDALRSKEYELRDELYYAVLDILKLRKPKITSFARFEITNNMTSKRKVRALIQEKKIDGWDDPRLVTVRALRRRGITVEALRNIALSFGLSKKESQISMNVILDANRRIIDPKTKRLFAINDPIEVEVENIGENQSSISIPLHPTENLGSRSYDTTKGLLIKSENAATIKSGDVLRLRRAFNIKISEISPDKIIAEYAGNETNDKAKMTYWIPKEGMTKCELWDIGDLLINEEFNKNALTKRSCYAERYVNELNEGDVIQFEGQGMYKLDNKAEMRFISV